jgi:hypothetical protein
MKRGNTHRDKAKKWKKQKKTKEFILEHVMYTHISDNEFFTFPFYPDKKKNEKALKWGNKRILGVKNEKKNSTALRKNRFFTFSFYSWQEKKWKILKWGNEHLDRGKKWKKK